MTFLLRHAFVLLLAAVLSTNAAQACDCTPPGVLEGLKESDAVFRGKIRKITYLDPGNPGSRVIVDFEVSRVWKGSIKRHFKMHSIVETSFCEGFWRHDLIVGRELIVYAFRRTGSRLTTSICTRTGGVRQEDLQQLGEGHPPK